MGLEDSGLPLHVRGPEHQLNRGRANGYCPLDGDAKVPVANLPASALGGDVLSTGKPGGQQVIGSSDGAGTLILASGSTDPVLVNGNLRANVVQTGDLLLESKERNARWRFIEHHTRVQACNEITGEDMELLILPAQDARLLRRVLQALRFLHIFSRSKP